MLKRVIAALIALVVPASVLPGRPAQAAPGSVWHVVAPGETMRSIARDAGLRVADIGRWNQIVAPYPVHVDSTLRLTPPVEQLQDWRTNVEPVTPEMVGWDPAKKCPVPPADLRKVWVSYIDLQGEYRDGSIIVHRDVVTQVQKIFFTLFRWRFRIMAMSPNSGAGYVTAGYNCRPVGGTDVWSEHAYGYAIDINPLQNPMVRNGSITPSGGSYYLNRGSYKIGMIHAEGAARAFTANGYFWGGQWRSLKDFMHFSVTNR